MKSGQPGESRTSSESPLNSLLNKLGQPFQLVRDGPDKVQIKPSVPIARVTLEDLCDFMVPYEEYLPEHLFCVVTCAKEFHFFGNAAEYEEFLKRTIPRWSRTVISNYLTITDEKENHVD